MLELQLGPTACSAPAQQCGPARRGERDGSHRHTSPLESSWCVCRMAAGPAPACHRCQLQDHQVRKAPGISERPGSHAQHSQGKILLLTHHRDTALHLGQKSDPKRAEEGKPAVVRASAQVLGSHPHHLQQQLLLCSHHRCRAANSSKVPTQSSSEKVSPCISNLCPRSLLGLKVTLQLSICTNAMKERRGSVSQFIFQIGDKN